ncbi:MAG TPA: ABC transporter ATP-binding protein [Candidatus Ozemobacteraceae bacterium]|nr:ABC transporter ATP-binding protein [Candidatus Ozemobacteraceae bacterium]
MSENDKNAPPLTSAGPDLSGISSAPSRESPTAPVTAPPAPAAETAKPAPAPASPVEARDAHIPSEPPHAPLPSNGDKPPSTPPKPDAAKPAPATAPATQQKQHATPPHSPPPAAPAPRSFWRRLIGPFFNLPEEPGVPKPSPVTGGTDPAEGAGPQASAGPKPPVVTFRNVTKIFNEGTPHEYKAIENIDFEIEDLPDVGEFIALVGPSGCGKSTVLNLIQGFPDVWPPTRGEVLVRNRPVTGPGKDRGMIFQKYSSFPNRTVLENVTFGLEINRDALGYSPAEMKARAMDIIRKVGLLGHESKYPYQLSGGQQQRVAIARTLVLRPRIILMDEPFSALDEPTRIDMQALITQLWKEVEATVFIVTHSLAEAVYLGDRVFMFTPGPGKIADKIFIRPEEIGKAPGLSPLDVQEGPAFKARLREITERFLAIEDGGTH